MNYTDFYGKDNYLKLLSAQNGLNGIATSLKEINDGENDVQRIVYFTSRIKKPESMIKKLEQRNLPITLDSAMNTVFDAVGLRIICSFESDVHYVVEKLENDSSLTLVQKKDYLSYPKPNGYRSIHLCVKMKETGVNAEIQVRTIAMDFWATLEHQLKYKKDIKSEELIKKELKRCADEIASTDLSMQTIRDIIKDL